MDYKKLKKDELVKMLEEREELVVNAEKYKKNYESAVKVREEVTKENYELRKDFEKYKREVAPLKGNVARLENRNERLIAKVEEMKQSHKADIEKLKSYYGGQIDGFEEKAEDIERREQNIKTQLIELNTRLQKKDEEIEALKEKFNEDYKHIVDKFNKLASITEQYAQAFEDNILIQRAMNRNSLAQKELFEQKIKSLDEGDE